MNRILSLSVLAAAVLVPLASAALIKGNGTLSGSSGNDGTHGGRGQDTITCGDGMDTVHVDRADTVAADCERKLAARP